MVTPKEKRGVLKSALGKVTNAVGTALAAPVVAYHNLKGARADADTKALKRVRDWPKGHKGAYLDQKGKPTEWGIASTAADEVRFRYAKKNK